jgi:hypothetical protein
MELRVFIDNERRLNSNKVERFKDESNMQNVREFIHFNNVSAKDGGASEGIITRINKADEVFVQLYSLWMVTD